MSLLHNSSLRDRSDVCVGDVCRWGDCGLQVSGPTRSVLQTRHSTWSTNDANDRAGGNARRVVPTSPPATTGTHDRYPPPVPTTGEIAVETPHPDRVPVAEIQRALNDRGTAYPTLARLAPLTAQASTLWRCVAVTSPGECPTRIERAAPPGERCLCAGDLRTSFAGAGVVEFAEKQTICKCVQLCRRPRSLHRMADENAATPAVGRSSTRRRGSSSTTAWMPSPIDRWRKRRVCHWPESRITTRRWTT